MNTALEEELVRVIKAYADRDNPFLVIGDLSDVFRRIECRYIYQNLDSTRIKRSNLVIDE